MGPSTTIGFVCFDALHPSQKFFSHVGMGLPGLTPYKAVDKVSSFISLLKKVAQFLLVTIISFISHFDRSFFSSLMSYPMTKLPYTF